MSNHEYFRELCALGAIGQLSSDEDLQLRQHLYECESCRNVNLEYAHVVQHQLPKGDPIRWRIKGMLPTPAPDSDVRDRFLARAQAEGIEFTPEVLQTSGPRRIPLWFPRYWQAALAVPAVALAAFLAVAIHRMEERKSSSESMAAAQAQLVRANDMLRTELSQITQGANSFSLELAKEKRDESFSERSAERLQEQLEEVRGESQKLSAQLQSAESQKAELANSLQQKDSAVADLSAKNDKLHREEADNLAARVLLESQVRDLNNQIDQQAASFERERQLMAASKDVRQLMGARNLHIMDVHDTDGDGRSTKSFGRVFYAEGQSLIFYAFDLPSGRLSPAKYTFQAWGENEAVSHSVRNLGTFVVDDHEQHRWVLKVNEPKLLKGIDSVFVTAEVLGDATEPRGKKLLYAYLVGQPNHP